MYKFSAMTFNLKNDMIFTRSFLRWSSRINYVVDLIQTQTPDIIGVQELTGVMKKDLQPRLVDYQFIGEYRTNSQHNNESANILIKQSRFELINDETFWLSAHPHISGSKNFTSLFPRICTMVEVKDKETNQHLRIFNTHLDHLLPSSRQFEIGVIINKIIEVQTLHELPLILMGDLNTHDKSKVVQFLTNPKFTPFKFPLTSVNQTVDTFNTMHYGSGGKKDYKSPIDFIFINKQIQVIDTHIVTTSYRGFYPSDHYPVYATLKLK